MDCPGFRHFVANNDMLKPGEGGVYVFGRKDLPDSFSMGVVTRSST